MATNPMSQPVAGGTHYELVLAALRQVAGGVPPGRDAAFEEFRRLLAATLASESVVIPRPIRLLPELGDPCRRSEAAIVASVSSLEFFPRDSLDFAIEVGLVEELLAEHRVAVDADAAGSGDGGDGTEARWDLVGAVAEQIAGQLPRDETWTFRQWRAAADARARVLVQAREARARRPHE